jgi:hypothetical protein
MDREQHANDTGNTAIADSTFHKAVRVTDKYHSSRSFPIGVDARDPLHKCASRCVSSSS